MAAPATVQDHAIGCLRYALTAGRAKSPTWQAAAENCLPLLRAFVRESGSRRVAMVVTPLENALATDGPSRWLDVIFALEGALRAVLHPQP
jgi:hypothetical protein